MWQAIIAEVAKMVVGGVVGGVTQAVAIKNQIKEYEKAAEEVREAMQTTSGIALLNAQIAQGTKFAQQSARQTLGMAASKVKPESVKKVANTAKNQNFLNDFGQEAARVATIKDAQFGRATTRAQNIIGQADKQYTATVNTGQAINKGVGAAADIANDYFGSYKKNTSGE